MKDMIVIEFSFPAGRYHATPWGRHVNEADVEWPPSHWRLIRTLIATWHRKGDKERFGISILESLIETLAEFPPSFVLPPVRHAHTRHYMPVAGRKKTMVFDAFVQMSKDASLIVCWPGLELSDEASALLEHLVSKIGYLGRSESWAIGVLLLNWQGEVNCWPADTKGEDRWKGEMESVTTIAPLSKNEYLRQRKELLNTDAIKSLKGKRKKTLEKTLPDTLLSALSLDSGDLHAAGWSEPPSAGRVRYLRPYQALNSSVTRKSKPSTESLLPTARVQLVGKPLPRMEDAVRIGEIFRSALIHKINKRMGQEVPPLVNGHGLPKGNRHGHAFFLPEDADGDGRIDHLILHIPEGIPNVVRIAIDRMKKLWLNRGLEWRVVPDSVGERVGTLCGEARTWQSVTPYLHPWYKKKRFGVEEQLIRECRLRGFTEPVVELLETIPTGFGRRPVRPVHFHRFRSRRGLNQPDTRGSFVRLVFKQPVAGPLALGFGCHFGLGLFLPRDGGDP